MMRFITLLITILFITSCETDMMRINSRSDFFIAKIQKDNSILQKDENKTYLPQYIGAKNYSERLKQPDRLSIFEKALVDSSEYKIIFVNKRNNYLRGENVKLIIAGSPNTIYTLKIRYKSGYSSAKGLGITKSDIHGFAVWSFKISNVVINDDFTPWFEVSDGKTIVIHYFIVGENINNTNLNIPDKILTVDTEETTTANSETTKAEIDKDDDNSLKTVSEQNEQQTTSDEKETEQANINEDVELTAIIYTNACESYCRGENTTLTIQGEPNTVYTLKIRYKSGYSKSKGLGDVISDSNGLASWTFKISANVDISFKPWFEVSGAGTTAIHYFNLTDYEEVTSKPEDIDTPTTDQAVQITVAEILTPAETTGTIVFIDPKQSFSRGESVTLTISGLPNTVYTLKIKYKSGYSTAKGLGEATSNADGIASWTFKIGSRVNTSGFTPFFEVSGGGETAIQYFNVTD